ncbi:MAG: transglycosylase SLT domain-containing protein [Brevefilum sp.]|nr:transglycosylase SLT domain-containing protein [Brevefilum sp.]
MKRTIVIPAVFIGCLIVIWVGTVAASHMPSQALLAPTQTAIARAAQSPSNKAISPEASDEAANLKTDCSLSQRYPAEIQQWCQLIEAASTMTNLPSGLIAAVMLQESGGNPLSYSSSGAVGLMQVMPRDGLASEFICINGPCFSSRPTIEELEDPEFNINYGSRMLADLYLTHGSYREALFRYGPMNIGYHYADLVLKIWKSYG